MFSIRDASLLVQHARRTASLTQRELAERVGTSQSAIARLEQGHTNPTLDTLMRCAAATGHTVRLAFVPIDPPDPVVARYKRDVDRTLLRENLRKSVDERLRSLMDWQEAGRELQRATRAARRRR